MTPPALALYRVLTRRGTRQGRRLLRRRLAAGKEDPGRIGERQGIAGLPRPAGTLIWFHAASVGESLSLLEVIRRILEEDRATVLVSTGTVTSASLLAARLPGGAIQQFAPLDLPAFTEPFLDHWRPNLAVFTESEIWPNLILGAVSRGVPLILLNARLSERSARRWARLRGSARRLFGAFAAVQAQDAGTARALVRIGLPPERVRVTGTLKEGMPPPPCNDADRAAIGRHLDGRPVWAAASTHEGEEEIAAEAQATAARQVPRLLLILVPRHPDRGPAIAEAIRRGGTAVALRSAGEMPGPDIAVYVADTLGELGLWYRLAPVSFVGGSLAQVGGHNPFEPAALGSAILHGPHVANFADIYARLDAAGAAQRVTDARTLSEAVVALAEPDRRAPMAYAAWEITSSGADVTNQALAVIRAHLPAGAAAAPPAAP